MASATAPETVRPSMLVPITALSPSKTNPRTRFNEDSLKELAASMAPPVGIIEPLVVRPNGEVGSYEIVAGERRYRAAKIAGLTVVPVIVRDLDDAQVLDLQLIENKHRDDIHPLEEARAIERRIKLDRQLTSKGMAKFLGLSERYVQNRLRYLTLIPELQKKFLDEVFTAGHADLLIRLSPEDQHRALKVGLVGEVWDGTERVPSVRSVRDLDLWLKENIRLKAADAQKQPDLFPELAAALQPDAGGKVPTLIELTDGWFSEPGQPLGAENWREVKPKERACGYQQRGVMVIGLRQGRVLTVCAGRGKCEMHFPESIKKPAAPTPTKSTASSKPAKKSKWQVADEKAREQRQHEEALWQKAEKPILDLLSKTALRAKPNAKTVGFLATRFGGEAKTFGELIQNIVVTDIYRLSDAQQAAKALGVNLQPLLKAPAAKTPEPKRAVKKAAKKTAGGRKKK